MFLFSSKFISKAGSINHGLFGFFLRVLGLLEHVINLSMHGMNGRFQTPFIRASLRIDGSHVINSASGLCQFHVSLLLATVSGIQKGTGLFKLTLKSISTAIGQTSLLSNLTALTAFFLIETLNISELGLIPLDRLVGFSISLVGMIKSNLKLIDVRLKLLLDAKSLSFQRSLQGVHGTLVVFTGVIKLLFLLLDLAINFLTNLSKCQLCSQNLVLLLFKGSLSLLKCSLKLFLLDLKTASLFVQLMDGATTIAKLIKEILDFISEVLVFPLHNIELLRGLIPGCLQSEQFAVVVATFLLAGFNLGSKIINLGLPFSNDLIKVPASLLSNDSSSMDSLILKLKILKLSLKAMFSLFSACNLLVQGFNGFLSLHKPGRKLLLAALKPINSAQSFSLKLGPPQLNFSLRFGQCLESIRFLF